MKYTPIEIATMLQDLQITNNKLTKQIYDLEMVMYKASLRGPIDFDGDNFKKEDRIHNNIILT